MTREKTKQILIKQKLNENEWVFKFTWYLIISLEFDWAARQFNANTQQSVEFHANSMSSLHSIKFCVRDLSSGNVLRNWLKNGWSSKWNVSVHVLSLFIVHSLWILFETEKNKIDIEIKWSL